MRRRAPKSQAALPLPLGFAHWSSFNAPPSMSKYADPAKDWSACSAPQHLVALCSLEVIKDRVKYDRLPVPVHVPVEQNPTDQASGTGYR